MTNNSICSKINTTDKEQTQNKTPKIYIERIKRVIVMDLISIVKEMYGFTTKKAKEYLKTITEEHKKELKKYFINNSKKSFED